MYPADRELTPTSFESITGAQPVSREPAPPSRLRKVARVGKWIAIVAVTAVAAALIFINTPWGKELARSRIEKALGKKVNGRVSVAAVDYSFLFSDVEIRGLRIEDASGAQAIALDRVAVDLDRGSLVSGAPVLDRLRVAGLDVDIRKNADGTSNLTGLFKKSEREPIHLRVAALEVDGATLTVRKPDGTIIDVADLAITGSVDADGPNQITSLDLASVAADLAITRPGRDTRELELAIGAGAVSIDKSKGRAVRAELSEITAGPLSIDSIEARTASGDGQLTGDQKIAISGLSVAAAELEALLGRPVLGGDVTADLSIAGAPAEMKVDGAIATAGGTLTIDGSIDAADLAMPSYQVTIAGDEINTASMLAPEPRSLESQLRVALSGTGGDLSLAVDAGASVLDLGARQIPIDVVEVRARRAGGALTLESLVARGLGVEVKASGALSEGRRLDGELAITADPVAVTREAKKLGVILPRLLDEPFAIRASASGELDGAVDVELAPAAISVARGRATVSGAARLEKNGGHLVVTSADVAVDLDGIDLETAARLAGRPPRVAGSLGGELRIKRRGAERTVRYDLAARLARPALAITASGSLDDRRATATIRTGLGTVEASLPLTRRAGKPALALDRELAIKTDIPATRLDELLRLLPAERAERIRAKVRGGEIAARIDIGGTARAPRGTISVDVDAGLVKLAGKALELDGDLRIETADGRLAIRPDVAVGLAGVSGELAEITGAIDLGAHVRDGKLDLKAAARGAALDIDIDVARRPARSLAPLRARLAKAGGAIDGHIAITGTPREPQLDGGFGWTGYATAAGTPGGARLDFAGTPKDLIATVGLGAVRPRGHDTATIRARVERGATTRVRARARADRASLAELLPALGRDLRAELGTLDWNMDADVTLADRALARADVRGHLDVSGASVALPGKRRYRDVGLRIEAKPDRLDIVRLSARESDAQNQDRRVAITGGLALAKLRPTRLDLDIRADDWLVFGGSMGRADAPRASLDAELAVAVDMTRPIWAVDATVRSLRLDNAERYDRAHVPEDLSTNRDVMFLDDPNVVVGKLAPVAETAAETATAPRRKRRPMDVKIRFAKAARIIKAPLDIAVTGELDIAVRESGVSKHGTLQITDGTLDLFGHPHALERGRIDFDDAHPRGELDLVFARELSPAVARQLSRASAGGSKITIALSGPLAKREVRLGGAGAGGFVETLGWENAGRGMYHTEPGLPASASVQAPRGEQPLVLTFIQTNLPHMQVLDRFSAWSEPDRDRGSYARVERFEGERYGRDNKSRLKVVARPETLGRSRAEVQLDRLWINNKSLAVGAGVRAGSRQGGGVGVFLEWSSDD